MSADISQFYRVLEKFRFIEPVPDEVQQHIGDTKRDQFIRTLRKAGGYSFLFGLISYLFFTVKKMGVGITIIKSAVVLMASTVISIAIVSSGIYLSVRYFVKAQHEVERQVMIDEKGFPTGIEIRERIMKEEPVGEEPVAVIENRLGVQPFLAENVEDDIAIRVTDRIAEMLIEHKGSNRIVNLKKGRRGKRVGMMLMGSIEFLEGAYTITAKIVDVKDSKILFYASETMDSVDEINSACARISSKIISKIK